MAEEILETIKRMATRALEKLERFGGGEMTGVVNRNASVDFELRLPVGRGVETRRLMIDVENAVKPVKLGKRSGRVWISVALRFPPSHVGGVKERIKYDRVKGQLQVGAFWQASSKQAYNFVVTRRKLLKAMQENRRRKPTFIIVKYHWNPWNLKPDKV
jgi:hypothetical protein